MTLTKGGGPHWVHNCSIGRTKITLRSWPQRNSKVAPQTTLKLSSLSMFYLPNLFFYIRHSYTKTLTPPLTPTVTLSNLQTCQNVSDLCKFRVLDKSLHLHPKLEDTLEWTLNKLLNFLSAIPVSSKFAALFSFWCSHDAVQIECLITGLSSLCFSTWKINLFHPLLGRPCLFNYFVDGKLLGEG